MEVSQFLTVELRDLRWAIAISQHRSLRQAAEALNIRQSTLSRRLREVEDRLGADLFERTNGGTQPTIAGLEFIETARRILDDIDSAVRRLNARSHGESGRLTIGVYSSLTAGNFRATLAEHHRRFPEVDVYMVDGGHDRLMAELAARAIDVAVISSYRLSWDGRSLPLWSERVIAALPRDHPLGAHTLLSWPMLANERVFLAQRGPGPELDRLLNAKLKISDARYIQRHDVSVDRLLSLVSAGYGIMPVLEGATGAQYDGVVYREVHGEDGPTRLNFMAYWREANINPTLRPFLDILRERYPDLSAPSAPG
jgi:DNA-binding transcriptional LysR family regulator